MLFGKAIKYIFKLFYAFRVYSFKNVYFYSLDPLRAYKRETIDLELPGELSIFNIDWFSIFDLDTKENLGSIVIPDGLNVPPSLIKVFVSLICLLIECFIIYETNYYLASQRSSS